MFALVLVLLLLNIPETAKAEGEEGRYLNYSNISSNSTMIGTSAMFSVLWSSNGTLASYIFEWNFLGSFVADSSVNWGNTTSPQWSNITKSLGTDTSKWHDTVQWRINATAQDNTLNNTEIQSFTLTAIVVTYHVPDTGTLKINSTATSNSTAKYPWESSLIADSLPITGYTFYNFTENSVYYNSNPSTITFPVIDFMNDYNSDFTMILGTVGGGGRDLVGGFWFFAILVGILIIPISIAFILLHKRRR